MKNRGNIIIIEGPQGVGKSTMANFLRDNLASSNLYRLTGIKDKTKTGYDKNKRMYLNLLNYMEELEDTELNLIFDRTFFTEQVYCLLGFKEYKFDDVYERLVQKLNALDFNIYYVVLYLNDTSIYEKRLKRQHHQYQAFSIESSVNQQNTYLKLADNLKAANINILKIATDNYEKAYNELINSIPILKDSNIIYKEEEK
ncbi:MAG: hypothetical protein MST00_03660 [Tenericutes bacterium]|nr:hypothetical protein [Mycoplasmatota bacterium]